jgi:2-oxoglutarate dehydrogenase E2 component (dihydrolipoamide succinyltransferase)
MTIEIKVPALPESVTDATIATWHKKPGDSVQRDENLVDIETDKVVLEVVAPEAGILEKVLKNSGDNVKAQEVIAVFKVGAQAAVAPATASTATISSDAPKSAPTPVAAAAPSVRRMMNEEGVNPSDVNGTGQGGRITKEDVQKSLSAPGSQTQAPAIDAAAVVITGSRTEKRVPMTRLRARIAERLLNAQQTAAILTTFNEVNMKPVMDLRTKYKDRFEKAHGAKLGFMSFFTKAVVEALKRFPVVNSSIDGQDIVYHGYCDVGIAVSSPRGLVVPILRNAENLSMAQIEKGITSLGEKARDGKLSIEEMTGGTFTISNGGVFGSLMSTPILNPPQTGILGMHKIEDRAVVENGQIVVRPMMYLALSYDHRVIDGSESVRFLVTIKELLEDPARLLLEI